MRQTIWTISAALALATSTPALAAQSSKEEAIGVGTGGVIGAVAGGPIGFVIGAAIGAKLGDKAHDKNEQIETLSASLADSQASVEDLSIDVRTLTADIDTMNLELDRLERVAHPELLSLMQAGIEMDLLFRTDESELPKAHRQRLQEFADALAAMPNIQVHLDGFADERGNADYNLALSAKRVAFVREQLLAAGMNPARISDAAHGEVAAIDTTIDSMALERRVSLKVFIDDAPAVAAIPTQTTPASTAKY